VALDNCVHGYFKLLYVSPERLTTEIMKVRAGRMHVNLLAVDEAHCISQWGYDFRPPYLRIAEFRKLLPQVPVLALTATATPEVAEDICHKLDFKNKRIFQKSFFRKNLSYSVLYEEDKQLRVLKMLQKVKGTSLIYVRNRRRTKEVAAFLSRNGISADYYHAGLDHASRSAKQENWMNDQTRVMVCTNAFGMGIDKSAVRLVIHWDVPDDLESYFQEAGRAGRDEKKSFAVLLYNKSDLLDLDERMKHGIPTVEQLRSTYQALCNFLQLAMGAGEGASFDFDMAKFCKAYRLNPLSAYESLSTLQQEGYIATTDHVFLPSRVFITVQKDVLYTFEVENRKYEPIIRALLRAYSGIFEEFVTINEFEIARHLGVSRDAVCDQLKQLQHFHLLQYEPQKDAPQIVFTRPRADAATMSLDIKLLNRRRAAHEKRLGMMKHYSMQRIECRSQVLLYYFGETGSARCGICDVCLGRNKLQLSDVEFEEIRSRVRSLLSDHPLSLNDLVSKSGKTAENKVLETVQFLLDNEELKFNESNQLILPTN
jgi:ATP-dependent DNA helicase RecQ